MALILKFATLISKGRSDVVEGKASIMQVMKTDWGAGTDARFRYL